MLLECPNRMAISFSHQRPWERVAQPVEHVTFNHGVLGSSPSALTKNSVLLGYPRHRGADLTKLGTRRGHKTRRREPEGPLLRGHVAPIGELAAKLLRALPSSVDRLRIDLKTREHGASPLR